MSGRTEKKIRKQVRQTVDRQTETIAKQQILAFMNAPLKVRIIMALHIIIGR
jgi:hypothetical protein